PASRRFQHRAPPAGPPGGHGCHPCIPTSQPAACPCRHGARAPAGFLRSKGGAMHVTDAAYATVHDYPGGAGSLAPRIGTSQAVLNSKVNPNTTTHHLTLAEAVKLMVLTGDKRILHAIALETGDVVIEGAAAADDCEMAILGSLTGLFARTGQVGTAVHGALEDGRITERE